MMLSGTRVMEDRSIEKLIQETLGDRINKVCRNEPITLQLNV